jgi:hypothetical protein
VAIADEGLRRKVRRRRRRHLGQHRSAEAAFFTTAYMVNGKAPITKCENVAKYQTVADIDKPNVTVIENPGGSNERFARANFKQAKIVIFQDNVTIFDEILKGNADVMISESVERSSSRSCDRDCAPSTRTSRSSMAKWRGCSRAAMPR